MLFRFYSSLNCTCPSLGLQTWSVGTVRKIARRQSIVLVVSLPLFLPFAVSSAEELVTSCCLKLTCVSCSCLFNNHVHSLSPSRTPLLRLFPHSRFRSLKPSQLPCNRSRPLYLLSRTLNMEETCSSDAARGGLRHGEFNVRRSRTNDKGKRLFACREGSEGNQVPDHRW